MYRPRFRFPLRASRRYRSRAFLWNVTGAAFFTTAVLDNLSQRPAWAKRKTCTNIVSVWFNGIAPFSLIWNRKNGFESSLSRFTCIISQVRAHVNTIFTNNENIFSEHLCFVGYSSIMNIYNAAHGKEKRSGRFSTPFGKLFCILRGNQLSGGDQLGQRPAHVLSLIHISEPTRRS